jgi:hypothetical protein
MVTMSPLTDNQFVVAVRTGKLYDDGESATTLYEAFDHKNDAGGGPEARPMPTPQNIQQACIGDPVAAAEYFDKISNYFIENVLGWDPKNHCSVDGGGLFGHPQAYAAGIETQGCSLLHFHMLIWLENMPHTAEEEVGYEDYNKHLAAYIDSIVTNELPIMELFSFPLPQHEVEALRKSASVQKHEDSVASEGAALPMCSMPAVDSDAEVQVNFSIISTNE